MNADLLLVFTEEGKYITTVNFAEARAAVMHKRRLSAGGAVLYDGRPRRVLCRQTKNRPGVSGLLHKQ
ncbi:hypothetical protein M7775_20930 [Sporomusa sphaeroides DSM 2875]|uniref:hypothetical protein n=1 Tax=Sporomusa sphaeroides TaxID=47679 RepID=UPI000950E214|nr:hypothetical protein [Sporomusa sphaeroides]MCM0761017.1 hypothetical protein [Sporomusa sphaeroides DSM 2875]